MKSVEYEGCNLAHQEHKVLELDCYCPAIGSPEGRNNYSKERCIVRQKDVKQPSCYGGCKAIKGKSWHVQVEPIVRERKRRPRGHTKGDATRASIEKLMNKGLTSEQIAKKVGKHRGTVTTYLKLIRDGRIRDSQKAKK